MNILSPHQIKSMLARGEEVIFPMTLVEMKSFEIRRAVDEIAFAANNGQTSFAYKFSEYAWKRKSLKIHVQKILNRNGYTTENLPNHEMYISFEPLHHFS